MWKGLPFIDAMMQHSTVFRSGNTEVAKHKNILINSFSFYVVQTNHQFRMNSFDLFAYILRL